MMKHFIRLIVLFIFSVNLTLISPNIWAGVSMGELPLPGVRLALSPKVSPAVLRGLTINKDNPFAFDFILDQGKLAQKPEISNQNKEADRLIKYFFAALTIPESDVWVNLSPFENNRIIPDALGKTAMGRDLLGQDYILKQLSSSLLYPKAGIGKEFWARVYQKAQERYGKEVTIPLSTFNRVWIVAKKAHVFTKGQTAWVVDAHLDVMLEEDYLATNKNQINITTNKGALISTEVFREIIIPILRTEINEGAHFSKLRQVFYSLILAAWFKKTLKSSIINKSYSNQSKVGGIEDELNPNPQMIYSQYLKAYKKGTVNLIDETKDNLSEPVVRKYFSGGVVVDPDALSVTQQRPEIPMDHGYYQVKVNADPAASQAMVVIKKGKINLYHTSSGKRVTVDANNHVYFGQQLLHKPLNTQDLVRVYIYGSLIMLQSGNRVKFFIERSGDIFTLPAHRLQELFDIREKDWQATKEALLPVGPNDWFRFEYFAVTNSIFFKFSKAANKFLLLNVVNATQKILDNSFADLKPFNYKEENQFFSGINNRNVLNKLNEFKQHMDRFNISIAEARNVSDVEITWPFQDGDSSLRGFDQYFIDDFSNYLNANHSDSLSFVAKHGPSQQYTRALLKYTYAKSRYDKSKFLTIINKFLDDLIGKINHQLSNDNAMIINKSIDMAEPDPNDKSYLEVKVVKDDAKGFSQLLTNNIKPLVNFLVLKLKGPNQKDYQVYAALLKAPNHKPISYTYDQIQRLYPTQYNYARGWGIKIVFPDNVWVQVAMVGNSQVRITNSRGDKNISEVIFKVLSKEYNLKLIQPAKPNSAMTVLSREVGGINLDVNKMHLEETKAMSEEPVINTSNNITNIDQLTPRITTITPIPFELIDKRFFTIN